MFQQLTTCVSSTPLLVFQQLTTCVSSTHYLCFSNSLLVFQQLATCASATTSCVAAAVIFAAAINDCSLGVATVVITWGYITTVAANYTSSTGSSCISAGTSCIAAATSWFFWVFFSWPEKSTIILFAHLMHELFCHPIHNNENIGDVRVTSAPPSQLMSSHDCLCGTLQSLSSLKPLRLGTPLSCWSYFFFELHD